MKRIISLFLSAVIMLSMPAVVPLNTVAAASNDDCLFFDGHTYVLFDSGYDWISARKYCEDIGGHLATITSKKENDAVYNWLTSKGYYTVFLGASCESGEWEWVTGEPFAYRNWHLGEPSGGTEKYLEYYSSFRDGTWNDTTNNVTPFVCEFDSNVENSVSPFKMIGNARYYPITDTYQLTSLKKYDFGCIWLNKDIDSNFEISFEYRTGGGTQREYGGADGFVFMFYADKNFSQGRGEELGFVGCNGYGIEFDSYCNENRNDSENPHIALIKDDTGNHIISEDNETVEDDRWHTASVSVQNGKISVNVDGKNVFEWEGEIEKGGGNFGFSATTGQGMNDHFIRNIQINAGEKKTSDSTSDNAPVIKSVQLQDDSKCCNLINQKVTINTKSDQKMTLIADIDWNGAEKPRVYITQGGQVKDGSGISNDFNNTDGVFEDIILTSKLKPDMPVYILAMDESTGCSTSVETKLNIIDLSEDDIYQEVMKQEGVNLKLGKDMEFAIPDDVPVVGGLKLTWKINPFPVTVAYESNDKMAVTLGLDIDTLEKDGLKKFEGFEFKDFKTIVDDYSESLNKYGDDILKAYKKQNRSLKQLRNDFRMSEANKTKNKGLTMSAWGGKILKNTGKGDSDAGIEAIGYAEVHKENGKWNWNKASGCILFQVSVEYTYNGQAFIWVIPVCYSFGGDASAGVNASVKGMSETGFVPYFESYLLANLELSVSGGVGVSKVANFNAKASGDLSLQYGLSDSCAKYDEVLLDGKVDFNVVLLGKTVGSLKVADLADEYGVIYSEDPDKYSQSWIKPDNSESIGLMSVQEQLGSYSAENVYENESRDYLVNSMEWRGNMPAASLFAADRTNKNLTVLADSVYPQAQPQIFSVNGKKVLIFTADNDARTADNKQMLVYSVYDDENETWSEPLPVDDDETADFYPSACGEYLVWQNQKSVMGDGLSLAEIGKQGEIVIAKWNGSGFDEPAALTDNEALDTFPVICRNNNEVSVVWLKNSADDILGADGSTSIVKKVFDGSVWSQEIILKDNLHSVTNLSAGYSENALNVSYVHDEDGDITTIDDLEVYLIGSSEKQVTDNEVLDSNAIINNGKLYWYSENNIHIMNLADGTESTVFEDARHALTDSFTVSEDNGNIAVLWSGSEGEGSEIKGVLYQEGSWSDVITVSESGAYAKYPTCILEKDGSILASFSVESDGITNLYTLGLFPSYDLAITDIYFDEKNLDLNSENEFEITVTNNGELSVEGYTINVYNEDETLNNSIVFEDTIKAGESKAAAGRFITGESISYETLKIEIALNAKEEYVYDNNFAALSIGNGDISLESVDVYEILPTSYAVADVKNIGYSDISGITVNLRKDSGDGEIVQSKTVDSLAAGSNEEVTFAYDPEDYENVKWYITVETEAQEVSAGNNRDYFINECAVGLEDYEISILNYSYADKRLTVNGFARNNTDEPLTCDAVYAIYSSEGKMKGITIQPLNVEAYSDTGIDVWFEDYTYVSGDYIKMFMRSGSDDLKPLVSAERIDVA